MLKEIYASIIILASISVGICSEFAINFEVDEQVGQNYDIDIYLDHAPNICGYDNSTLSKGVLPNGHKYFTYTKLKNVYLKFANSSRDTIIYKFELYEDDVKYLGGYHHTEKMIQQKKIVIFDRANVPEYNVIREGHAKTVNLQGHVRLLDTPIHSVLCPASTRTVTTSYFDIDIETKPTGANIWLDGEKMQFRTQQTLRVPESKNGVILVLEKDGFMPHVETLSEDKSISISLRKTKVD